MSKKTKLPPREEILEVLKKFDEDYKRGDYRVHLPEDAPPTDKLKEVLCEQVIRYRRVHSVSNIELAAILGIDPARVSEILYAKIHLYSIDRLLQLVSILAKDDKSIQQKLDKLIGVFRASS